MVLHNFFPPFIPVYRAIMNLARRVITCVTFDSISHTFKFELLCGRWYGRNIYA